MMPVQHVHADGLSELVDRQLLQQGRGGGRRRLQGLAARRPGQRQSQPVHAAYGGQQQHQRGRRLVHADTCAEGEGLQVSRRGGKGDALQAGGCDRG